MKVEFFYPVFAVFMGILVVVFVPKERYRSLFWPSLVWGFGVSFMFAFIFGRNLFDMARYVKDEPFVFLHIPIWLNFAWFEAMMLYLYYLPTQKAWYVFPVYVLMFAVVGTGIQEVFYTAGLMVYKHWGNYIRFPLNLVWFYGAAKHYRIFATYDTKDGE